MKNKARHLITGKQIEKIIKLAMDEKFRKITILMNRIRNEQYIGDSDKKVKDDLSDYRIIIDN